MRAQAVARGLAGLALTLLGCAGVSRESPESPAPAPVAGRLVGPARQLTFEGRRSGEGYFAHDGRRLVFQSEREPGNPFYQIYVMDLQSGGVERVSPGVGKTTCGWIHPGGRRVLFASTHLDPQSPALQQQELAARASGEQRRYEWDYDPHYDLFSVRLPAPPGEGPRRLTSAVGYDAEASWSPDGRRIVFSSNRHAFRQPDSKQEPAQERDATPATSLSEAERDELARDPARFIDLYVMDSNGRNLRRLTETPGYDGGPFFSPDGGRIVFRRFSLDGATAEIHTMDAKGGESTQLTRLGAMSWAPFYHPSGDYVIFTTNVHGFENFELYLVDVEGRSEPIRVTDEEGFDGLPAFSPAGDELVWTRRPKGRRSQLYRAPWSDALAREKLGLPSRSFHGAGPLLPVPRGLSPEIEAAELERFVADLTSEPAAGRLTGSAGERIATGYVARVFRSLGLEPAGDAGSYFQEFGFTAGVSLGSQNRLVASGLESASGGDAASFTLDRDWRPLAFTQVGSVPASEIAFAGYGLVARASADVEAFDDYAHLDVEGRWVLVLRYVPANLSEAERRHLRRHASLRYKGMVARDRGARGILFVSGPASKVHEELVPLRFDASFAGTSIAALSISDATADRLLEGTPHTIADLQKSLDAGIAVPRFTIDGVGLEADVDVQQQRKKGRNVLARLAPTDASGEDEAAAPAIVLGAHVDHLGTGEGSGSLARGAERGRVHPGADDNASGVAALVEAAHALADRQARGDLVSVRPILFAAWSGEELGLLGSTHFVSQLGSARDAGHGGGDDVSHAVAAYLNLDMVGRMQESVALFGVDSSPVWMRELERRNVAIGLPIDPQGDSYLPTDATAFYLKGVPVLSAFTGAHEDYHTPRDTPEKLDYETMAKTAALMAAITASLAASDEAPPYVATAPTSQALPRAGLRVYLGTIPDYTDSEDAGLRLSGVARGGPAEAAGLESGDVVVEVDGRSIENIYDYTYSLEDLQVGVSVEIVVRRRGETVRLTITPASRD